MPAGPGNIGKVNAVAINPSGDLIAVGGWTSGMTADESIYLFDRAGTMITRIGGLPDVVTKLVFSSNGRFLAAGLKQMKGLRVYDHDKQWLQVFEDPHYQDDINGITFAEDGRLATASSDTVRLYDLNFALVVPAKVITEGKCLYQIAFSSDGALLAVGYEEEDSLVALLDGHNLETKAGPNTKGLKKILSM